MKQLLRQSSFLVIAAIFFCLAYFVERMFFPIVENFNVSSIDKFGPHIVIAGTLNKVRACELVQDIQAFNKNGERLEVEFLDRNGDKISRPAIKNAAQQFGPWVIKNGSNESVSLYSLHKCHGLWTQETKLVTIEDSK